MKALIAVVAALSLSPAAAAAPFTLVRVTDERRAEALPALGLHRAELVSETLGVWRLPAPVARQVAPRLRAAGLVVDVEPDTTIATGATSATYSDPLFPEQRWYARVGADRAEPPGPGRPVTVIDSAVDLSHPEFSGRPNTTALNRQVSSPGRLGEPEYHGTAVASVVAAPANGVGIVGVYPQAVLQVYDAAPRGDLLLSDVISGIDAASLAGDGVINLSLGAPGQSDLFKTIVGVAYGRGSVVVAASGNSREDGSPAEFPAGYPHVLTVGATDAADAPTVFSSASPRMDLAAPGEGIPIALPLSLVRSGYSLNGDGTSFAAPIVSGAAAWVWTVRPELDSTQLYEVVRRSARDAAAPGWDPDTGFGILDIPAALAYPAPPRDPLEPNDDFDLVRGGGLLSQPALTTLRRGSSRVLARLDAREDPDDVYRILVPAGKSVTVTAQSSEGDADLELWSDDAESLEAREAGLTQERLGRSARAGGTETVTWANRGRGAGTVFAAVYPRAGSETATYVLGVSTKTLPKAKAKPRPAKAPKKKR